MLCFESRLGSCAPSCHAASVRIRPWQRSMPTWFLYPNAGTVMSTYPDGPSRTGRIAVAVVEPHPDWRVPADPGRSSAEEQGRGGAGWQAGAHRLGSPSVGEATAWVQLCRPDGTGQSRRPGCGSVHDVCGRWTRDGLTVDPAMWKPGARMALGHRVSLCGNQQQADVDRHRPVSTEHAKPCAAEHARDHDADQRRGVLQ